MCHASSPQAYKCFARYLVRVLGFTRHRNREFAPPNGGPRTVLTKQSRFGGIMRAGKSGEAKSKRVVPKRGGGILISQ